jgi:GH25 family lysozyme M1 (1,4-beta-N-acetylmuramidase)
VLLSATMLLRWTCAVATVACLALLGLTALPSVASAGRTAGQGVAHAKPQWLRSNTGYTHSPQLLRELAGPAHSGTTVINGPRAAATAGPVAGAAQGIDVSSHQESQSGGINWKTIAGDGIKFAAVKSTEGAYYTNPYALTDLPGAQSAGLTTVAYAFAIPNGGSNGSVHYSSSPAVQADDLVNYLTGNGLTVPPVMLDIENDPYAGPLPGGDGTTGSCYGLSQSAMVSWISGFNAEIQARTGQLPIIYTNPSWWSTCTGGSTVFGQTPIWAASWTTASSPSLPAGWSTWNLWQYTDMGVVTGITGNTDLDQLNPGLITLLNPGIQHDPAASAIQTLKVTPFTVSPAPSLTFTQSGLPAGLTIDTTTGQITGTTPAVPGPSHVIVTATDPGPGTTGTATFTWDVYGTITVTPGTNQSTVAGAPVYQQMTAADSASGYSPSFTASGLPGGVSISSNGLITGWPDSPGTYNSTVTATDSLNGSGSASFTWTVSAAPGTGPTGPVRLDAGGKCLNDVGNSSANGTQTDIWTCNGSTSQKYTYAQDESLRIHGKCLTAQGSAALKVLLEPCTGTSSGQWMPVYPRSVNAKAGAVPLALVNPASGWCLGVPGSTSNGARVLAGSCNGTTYQAWTPPAGPVGSQLPGKCLDDRANSTVNGTTIDLWSCNGTAAQQWTAEPDGTIRVHGKCLDVHSGATASGTPVDLWSCNGTAAQQWHLLPDGAGARIVNPHSGRCLTDPGDATVSGTALKIVTCAGAPGQRWRIR